MNIERTILIVAEMLDDIANDRYADIERSDIRLCVDALRGDPIASVIIEDRRKACSVTN